MASISDTLIRDGLTFDDVLLEPGPSDVMPGDVNISTLLSLAALGGLLLAARL